MGAITEGSEVKTATPGQRATGLGELIGTGLQSYLGAKAPELLSAAAKNKAVSVATANSGSSKGRRGEQLLPRLGKVMDFAEALKPKEAPVAQPPALLSRTHRIYDDIAKSLGGKKYSALNESGQEAVRKVFERMNAPQPTAPQAAPQPVGSVGQPAPEPVAEPPAPAPVEPSVAPQAQDTSALSPEDKFQALRRSLVDKGILPEKGTLGGTPARARFDEGGPSVTIKLDKTVIR